MKSGSCVKPGGWRWWVGPSFPLGRASGENLVQTGTAPFGYQPLPGTSVPMTHPWYSEVQGQDDVGGRGRSMARERVATAITRSPLAGRASEPPRARRSAGPSASSPCPSPLAPQRHTFTPSWKTPSFPPPRGSKPRRALVRAKAGATHPSRRRDPTPTPSDRSLTEPLA